MKRLYEFFGWCWHDYTKWEIVSKPVIRNLYDGRSISITLSYQQRKCKTCGYIEQEELDYI